MNQMHQRLTIREETVTPERLSTGRKETGVDFCDQNTRDYQPLRTIDLVTGHTLDLVLHLLPSGQHTFKCIATGVVYHCSGFARIRPG